MLLLTWKPCFGNYCTQLHFKLPYHFGSWQLGFQSSCFQVPGCWGNDLNPFQPFKWWPRFSRSSWFTGSEPFMLLQPLLSAGCYHLSLIFYLPRFISLIFSLLQADLQAVSGSEASLKYGEEVPSSAILQPFISEPPHSLGSRPHSLRLLLADLQFPLTLLFTVPSASGAVLIGSSQTLQDTFWAAWFLLLWPPQHWFFLI